MIMRWGYRPGRNISLGAFLFGGCAGLLLKTGIMSPVAMLGLLFVLGIIVLKKGGWWLVGLCFLIGICMGAWRSHSFYKQIVQYENYYGQSVEVTGRVNDDPGYNEYKLIEFHITGVTVDGKRLPGRIRVRSRDAYSVKRGDVVKVNGVLRRTLGSSRQGALSYGKITILHKNQSYVEIIRTKFFASVFSSLPEPQASLGLGYLAGVRASLPPEFAAAMSAVGLTHIVAVSGYNLTILVQFVKKLFEKRSAFQTVFFSSLLISGFLLITGWSPSISRAALISALSLLAWYYGRRFQPLIIILLGAVITAFINPLYIWGDVGWYLSFLAFTGVLLVAPMALYFMGKLGENFFIKILLETLSAQLMTAPYIMTIFGTFSIISPLANLLVVPFIPFAMLAVFATGLVGMLSPVAALWVAVPARSIMTITVWTVEKLAAVPWARMKAPLPFRTALLLYGLLAVVIVIAWCVYHKRAIQSNKEIDWNLL